MSAVAAAAAGADAPRASRRRCGASSRDFVANPRRASFGLALLVLIVLARALRAADLAAEPLRPRAARRHGQPPAAGLASADRRHVLARHRRPGPRHAVGDLLRPAHLASASASIATVIALAHRARARACSPPISAAGSRRSIMRIVDIQLSFPAILIALMLLAVLGRASSKVIARAGHRAVGVLRAHRARRRAGRDAQGIYRGGARASRCRRRASCSATCCRTACRR